MRDRIIDILWVALERTIVRPALSLHHRRHRALERRLAAQFQQHGVLSGLFSGLRYPELQTVGSSLWPKVLGTYERELEPHFRGLLRNAYDLIVDIGSAEGYYAVGLARLAATAEVVAVDISPRARELCAATARENHVDDRVTFLDGCSAETLCRLTAGRRSLIVSDCEGHEKELFTRESAEELRNCDLVVELHDCFDPSISRQLLDAFRTTHDVTIVDAISDHEKAASYQIPGCLELNYGIRRQLLAEGRPDGMQWLVGRRKNQQQSNGELSHSHRARHV